ncbi:glycoside hydrolase family 3 N-terminal domain-containing protein [Mesoterricola sediminis]|uniref:beta-N-acetylhexosaminidase n=1 Tax=Mesoterricola sediminis TaxID=2927980 RepID=A0AA48KBJ0_9BACT|nr:glycoside hydrolase family 3 N-terminal domain-containing protein [Mesoterricola sediminis]BDU76159.1 beta-hexosaminidase [Mesoterricola sediminis]
MQHAPAHRLLWTGFNGLDAAEVQPGFQPGGIVLFARNLDPDPAAGPARCHALIQDLQARWGPLAVAVDQEGGPVSRLRAWVGPTPALRAIWTHGGADGCRRWGGLWGRGLHMLGFNVDFAPVADLYDPAPDAALGSRCAADTPEAATAAAGAFLAGLEAEGVRGCLKHFPGLGGTRLDSHVGLPEVTDPARLDVHVGPFQALAHPDRLVMVAHLRTPLSGGLPGSLSFRCVAGNPWGIQARWLPDDLEMGGADGFTWEDKARRCLEAGHEALLVCQTPAAAEACAEAVTRLPETLWAPAAARFRALRLRLPRRADPFEATAWKAWVDEIREAAAQVP